MGNTMNHARHTRRNASEVKKCEETMESPSRLRNKLSKYQHSTPSPPPVRAPLLSHYRQHCPELRVYPFLSRCHSFTPQVRASQQNTACRWMCRTFHKGHHLCASSCNPCAACFVGSIHGCAHSCGFRFSRGDHLGITATGTAGSFLF